MPREDSRATLPSKIAILGETGRITFAKDERHYATRSGAVATDYTCPAWTALPIGLTFILDNTRGTGTLTLTPTTGSATTVTTGKIFQYIVAADGTLKRGELT